MGLTRWILGVVGLVGVGALGWALKTKSNPEARAATGGEAAPAASERVVAVVLVPVAQRDMPITVDGLGTVAAFNTVVVKSQVDGRLDHVAFREGQEVHRGDLLAQVDPRPFQIQLHQAQAALARDRATANAHKVTLARITSLQKEGLSSQQQLDDERAALQVAEAVTVADGAAIDTARLQLDYARITSPIDGVTGVRLVDAGNLVHPSDQGGIVVITQIEPIAVMFTLPQDDLPRVAKALAAGPVTVEAMSRDGETLLGKGQVALVDNQINQATATIKLKAILPNPQRVLWPNQFVKVRLLLTVRKDALVVPASVVQRGPQGTFAYVLGPDQKAAVRPVTVDTIEGAEAVIGKGLVAGEQVVTEGQYQLRPGSRVTQKQLDGARGAPSGSASAPPPASTGGKHGAGK